MATSQKPMCKFGEKCYRTNPQHLNQYDHPKKKQKKEEEPARKKQKKETGPVIEDFFGKKKTGRAESGSEEDESEIVTEDTTELKDEASTDEEDIGTPPASPLDVKENIKQKFLVEMPDDFYKFWEFCQAENPSQPLDALKSTLGYQLVGPFDILAGKHNGVTHNRHGRRPNYLLHWRYYYDPPEFMTVIRGDDDDQFHIGYFRDDPHEMPAFLGSNSAKSGKHSCIISNRGDNLFAAVRYFADQKHSADGTTSKMKTKLQDLSERLTTWAKKHDYSLAVNNDRKKARDKKVVCKAFHGAGIVVPVDENEVGYREVPETTANLKKMFTKIANSTTESERDKNYEDLQELITLVQFANDECDYGEGLELGIALFCFGGDVFHSTIEQLLPLAYMLLCRTEFQSIIEAHLKRRSRDVNLSEIE